MKSNVHASKKAKTEHEELYCNFLHLSRNSKELTERFSLNIDGIMSPIDIRQ